VGIEPFPDNRELEGSVLHLPDGWHMIRSAVTCQLEPSGTGGRDAEPPVGVIQ
jgi:hypothetical protein